LKELARLLLPSEINVGGQSSVLFRHSPAGEAELNFQARHLHRSALVASHGRQDALWNLLRRE